MGLGGWEQSKYFSCVNSRLKTLPLLQAAEKNKPTSRLMRWGDFFHGMIHTRGETHEAGEDLEMQIKRT